MKRLYNSMIDVLLHPASHAKLILTIVMVVLIPLTYLLVYMTGGIKFVYSHTMYIPIVVLAIIYGIKGGLVAAIIGGLLLGPFMVIDVTTGEIQDFFNWFYRLLIFMVIAGTVGLFAQRLRNQSDSIRKMALQNPETKLPFFTPINPNLSDKDFLNQYRKEVYVINVLNGSQIIELLGKDFYNQLLVDMVDKICTKFDDQASLFQIDTVRFAVLVEKTYKNDFPEELMKFFDSAFTIGEIPIHISIVLGISSSDESIFRRVEEAILATNTAKENHIQVAKFNPDSLPSTTDLAIVGAFKDALENGELYAVYQPVHDIQTNKVVNLESLIRWNHKEYGPLLPAQFIHLIENTQLINYLSEFVIVEAFKMLKKLDDEVSVSINLSANNFYSRFFINKIFDYLNTHDVDKTRMIFEITESILMEHPKKSVEIMKKFKTRGIRFAIDDFGTGYSSLAYINLFPIDYLKIDRFFIQRIDEENVYKIIKSTIELAHELNFEVVAEGVEKLSDTEILKKLNCDFIQGYSKSVPLKEKEILEYIKNNVIEKTSE